MRSWVGSIALAIPMLGVALDCLLVAHSSWPGLIRLSGLAPFLPLVPHLGAMRILTFAFLVTTCLLIGSWAIWLTRKDLAEGQKPDSEAAQDGHSLRWRQKGAGVSMQSDWYNPVGVRSDPCLPALFVAAPALYLLSAPERQLLLLVAAAVSAPAVHLGAAMTLMWLRHNRPQPMAVSPEGVTFLGHLFSWQAFSRFETDERRGLVAVFAQSLPKPPFVTLRPPDEMRAQVLALLHEHLMPMTAQESAVWRRRQWVWILEFAGIHLMAGVVVVGASLIPSRNLGCAVLAVAFLLLCGWLWGTIKRVTGLAAALRSGAVRKMAS